MSAYSATPGPSWAHQQATTKRPPGRAPVPLIVALLVVVTGVVIVAPDGRWVWAVNAQTVTGCEDGSRVQARKMLWERHEVPLPPVHYDDPIGRDSRTMGYVELHYHRPTRCAWAFASGGIFAEVWIDRSADGGETWAGGSRLGLRDFKWGGDGTYTGAFNDPYPYVVRACTTGNRTHYHCTAWF